MAKQKRDVLLKVRVTPEERELIRQKMALLGTDNMAAYMRKMAIDSFDALLKPLAEAGREVRQRGDTLSPPASGPQGIYPSVLH